MSDYIQHLIKNDGMNDLHPSAGVILLPLLDREGQTLSELAKKVHMKAPTITVIANRLESYGWIRRKRSSEDRRQVHLFLTDKGREKAEALDVIRRRLARQMSSGLNHASIVQANGILKQLIMNIDGRRD